MPGKPTPPVSKTNGSLSLREARTLILGNVFRRVPDRTVVQSLEEYGYVQIDTISRVERAHHHSLWSRVGGYVPGDLDNAVSGGEVFEYWSHAAAYLPVKSYRYCRPRMDRIRAENSDWRNDNGQIIEMIFDRIRAEGPLMTRDFKDERRSSTGWWDWKPAKVALERLFHEGQLAVKERVGFQKVYALPETVLPPAVDTSMPSESEMAAYLIDLSLKNTAFSRGRYLGSQHRDGHKAITTRAAEEIEAKTLVAVEVEDVGTWYCRPVLLENLLTRDSDGPVWVKVLSPFDGFIIQRGLIEELFNFPYRIECYVPADKRRYGYFSLPIVDSRGFAGMVDAKAERREGVLRVLAVHLYDGYARDPEFMRLFTDELDAFSKFNGCEKVEYVPDSYHILT